MRKPNPAPSSPPLNVQRLLGTDSGEWGSRDYILPIIALMSAALAAFVISNLPMSLPVS